MKGFRKIDNDLYEYLMAADLTRAGYKVILAVIHKTIGYNQRIEAGISLNTFIRLTKLTKHAVIDAIRQLEKEHFITVKRKAGDEGESLYSLRPVNDWGGSVVGCTTPSEADCTTETSKTALGGSAVTKGGGGAVRQSATPLYKEKRNIKRNEVSDAAASAVPALSFEDWLKRIKTLDDTKGNVIAVLGSFCRQVTGLEPDYSRIGALLKNGYKGDAGYLARNIWTAAAARPAGDFLSYVENMAKQKAKGGLHRANDEYIKANLGEWDTGDKD